MSNDSISNLSTGERFANGISSISNNLANNHHYSIERTANQNLTGSNHSSPNQPNPIYEYNLAELALLDNQRAQQYIQQQQTRHRQLNGTSAKQTERLQENTDAQQFNDSSNQLTNGNHLNGNHLNGNQLEIEDDNRPPPLPPLPSKHLLKRTNYYANIYSAPPQYTEPDFGLDNLAAAVPSSHSLSYSNPPQYTSSSNVPPIYGQTNPNSIATNVVENEFNGCTESSNSTANKSLNSNSLNNHHHHHHLPNHLPHHTNQNSLLSSMDGIRIQLARTKKQIAAVANTASQLNSSHLSQNGQSNATAAVSNAAQNLVANLVPNQIRAPQIQRSAEMQVSLKGWLYRLEGPALKQWKRYVVIYL